MVVCVVCILFLTCFLTASSVLQRYIIHAKINMVQYCLFLGTFKCFCRPSRRDFISGLTTPQKTVCGRIIIKKNLPQFNGG